jgi:hypothetical protein
MAHDGELLGDNLAAYIESGGGVVDAVSEIAQIPISGNYDSSAYRCIFPLDRNYGDVRTLDSVLLPEHPVMKNVLAFHGGTASISSSDSLAPGSYILALYDTSYFGSS